LALRTRIITAVIAAPIAVALVLLLPTSLFAEAAMLLMIGALFEWDNLTTGSNKRFVLSALILLAAGVVLFLLDTALVPSSLPGLLPWFCLLGSCLWLYQLFVLTRGIGYRRSPGVELLLGVLTMLCAWSGLVWLRLAEPGGAPLVLLAMLVVWAADIFAYVAGRLAGRNKLAPSISPGKTIEGVLGGLVGALVTAWIGSGLLHLDDAQGRKSLLLAAALAALISVVGDLSVSRLKRQAVVKDSGRLLPGHGGLLDRIDGLLAAVPVFAVCWWLLG
jgi:phosphatidate cytidylyltransferase